MNDRNVKDGRVRRKIILILALMAGGTLLAFFFHPAILSAGGKYLAPEGKGRADAVVIEGTEIIKERVLKAGMELISSGRAERLVVVFQNSEERPVGLPPDYALFLRQTIGSMGLDPDRITVYLVPQEHPVTLNEARIVLSKLAPENTRDIILLAENFHTRRSYWAYKQAGKSLSINVIPHPYFGGFTNDNWWQNAEGFSSFMGEGLKFLYYVFKGYIPIQSLART